MRINAWLVLATLTRWMQHSYTLQCHTCYGDAHCMEGSCHGEYCFVGEYRAYRDSASVNLKGCLNGSVMAPHIPDQCESARPFSGNDVALEDGRIVRDKTCLCSQRVSYCNRAVDSLRRRHAPKTKCYSDNPPHNYCFGDYCGLASIGDFASRFCVRQAIPVLERNLMGACVQPPVFHSLYPDTQALNSTVACICGDRKCNGRFPGEQHFFLRQQLCDVKFSLSVTQPGRLTTKYDIGNVPRCRGQFCYQLNMLTCQSCIGHHPKVALAPLPLRLRRHKQIDAEYELDDATCIFRSEGDTNTSTSMSGCVTYVRRWRRAFNVLATGGTLSFESAILRYRMVVWPYNAKMNNLSYTGDDEQRHIKPEQFRDNDTPRFHAVPLLHYPDTSNRVDAGERFGRQSPSMASASMNAAEVNTRFRHERLHDAALVVAVTLLAALLLLLLASCRFRLYRSHRGSYSTVAAK